MTLLLTLSAFAFSLVLILLLDAFFQAFEHVVVSVFSQLFVLDLVEVLVVWVHEIIVFRFACGFLISRSLQIGGIDKVVTLIV